MSDAEELWEAVADAVKNAINNGDGEVSAYYLKRSFKKHELVAAFRRDVTDIAFLSKVGALRRENDELREAGQKFLKYARGDWANSTELREFRAALSSKEAQ